MTAIELLRKHHEFADNIANNVATDETYLADNGDGVCILARKWYWQSDLRVQTIELLENEQ